MNPEFPQDDPRAQLEARLTAFILGELPAHEAAALRQAMEEDTQLAALYERLKAASKLVHEAAATPVEQAKETPAPLKLSEERRQKLLGAFKTVAPKEFDTEKPKRKVGIRLLEIAAVVAIIGVMAGMLLPALSKKSEHARDFALHENLRVSNAINTAEIKQAFTEDQIDENKQRKATGKTDDNATSGRSDLSNSGGIGFVTSTSPPVALGNTPSPVPTVIVLPPTESSENASNTTSNVYADNSFSWNVGSGKKSDEGNEPNSKIPITYANPQNIVAAPPPLGSTGGSGGTGDRNIHHVYVATLSNAEIRDVLPVLQDLFPTGNRSKSNTAANAAQTGPLITRSQTVVSSQNPATANSIVIGGGGAGGGASGGAGSSLPPVAAGIDRSENKSAFRNYRDQNGNPEVDPATGLPIAPLPPPGENANNDNGAIDPATGLPFAAPSVQIKAKFADITRTDSLSPPQVTVESGKTGEKIPALGEVSPFGRFFAQSSTTNNNFAGIGALGPATNYQNLGVIKQGSVLMSDSGQAARNYAWHISASTNSFTFNEPPFNRIARLNADGSIDTTFSSPGTATFSISGIATNFDDSGVMEIGTNHQVNLGLTSPKDAYGPKTVKQGEVQEQLNKPSKVESVSAVGYVNVNIQQDSSYVAAAGVDYVPTNGVVEFAKNEAATNGIFTAGKKIGDVTVTVDPETKRVFFVTDSDTALSVSNSIQNLERNGNSKTAQSQAYLNKKQELERLMAMREAMAQRVGGGAGGAATPNVMVIAEADGKARQQEAFHEQIARALTGNSTQTARIKIERDVTDVPAAAGQPSQTAIYDPYFIQTEFEVIQSEKILDQVVQRLKLNEAWSKGGRAPLNAADARAMLKRRLQISPEPNTSLADIKVESNNPEEAAKIANTIAEVYADYRKQQRQALIEGDAKMFQAGLAEQDKKIAQAQRDLAQLASEPASHETDAAKPKPSTPAPVPQPEVATSDNAFSTFSLNIADVSFKLAAASLEKGQMPEPASIRSEEFINAFDYRDPEPAPGSPLGFAWERAQYPFAQNRDLLRFSVKTAAAGREAGRPMNIVLLLDKSGSMERADRVRIIHEALRVLATQLQPQDKLSVVTFARVARLWADGLPGSQAGEVLNGLDKLIPEGGTNLEEAMRLAYETARRHYFAGGINRVVLLTDGAANLGNVDPDALKVKAEEHRKEGIALDCFGVSWDGYNDDLLEVLSRNGGGRYGFLNTPEEAAGDFAAQLAGALHVAASDVKVQVEFNPKRVTAYRQIGYAKLQLTKEQFRDNTVNAAQIGAAESGNALYAVEVNPNGEGPLATVRVRYKVPGTEEYPEHEWQVPYIGGTVSLEQASPAMRLAGTASAFSEWLASSPFAGEVTTDKLLGLMRNVPETYGADERPKKLEWMIRQAKSLEGK